MKRPLAIYLVAFWCLFALMLQLNGVAKGLKTGLSDIQIPEEIGRWAYRVAGILIIWHAVRLIQLKAFNRWFSIFGFAFCTLDLLWNLSGKLPNLENDGRPIVGTLSFCVLNGVCIWYLGRRNFRQFAVEYVAQRDAQKHSVAMKEVSQKKILNDLRS